MRKLLLLAACTLIACDGSTSPEDLFAVAVTATPTTIRAAGPMELDIAITNVTDDDQNLLTACQPLFEVRNAAGAVVGPGPLVCALALVAPVTIEAHATFHQALTWSGESSTVTSTGAPVYLSAGTYFIHPKVQVTDIGTVRGNAVAITITP